MQPRRASAELEVVLTAVGAVTAVGATAAQTFASVRAELSRMRECPELYVCLPEDPLSEPSPLVASPISHLDRTPLAARRAVDWLGLMAGHAVRDLLRTARLPAEAHRDAGLFCCLPALGDSWSPGALETFSCHLHNHARVDLLASRSLVVGDRSGALALADLACAALAEGRLRYAVVGGVDSYLFRERLLPLDRDYRLFSARAPDGFRPGEGAAFFLLERREDAAGRGATPLAVLRGSSAARATPRRTSLEPEPSGRALAPPAPNTGAALAEALAPLLDGGPEPFFLCDLNGESARTKEWAFTISRLGNALRPPVRLELPVTILGDLGAATGAMLVTLAVQYFAKRHVSRRRAVVWCASDDGERRALMLERS